MTDQTAETDVDFLEVLFGYGADLGRVLVEQAVCVACGRSGFHAHALRALLGQES